MNQKTKRIALLGICVSLAMLLSYIEHLLPPIWSAVPGIKIGLANIITLFLLYKLGVPEAISVASIRVALSALLFGSTVTLLYSASGALLSIVVMLLLKRMRAFSAVGVSIGGAVFHNVGQVLCAMLLLGTRELGYYAAVLTVTGTVSGIIVGISGALLLERIKRI